MPYKHFCVACTGEHIIVNAWVLRLWSVTGATPGQALAFVLVQDIGCQSTLLVAEADRMTPHLYQDVPTSSVL